MKPFRLCLWVALPQLLGAQPVTDFDASYPAWSPDGTRIAFQSNKDGADPEIYVLELEGGRLRRLTDNDSDDIHPAWSPDGSHLAFVSGRDGNPEIYRMNADGSDPVRLTHYPKRDLHPRFSPDGSRILFNRETGEGATSTALIYEMSRNGTDLEQITESRFPYTYPSWSADGGKILFVEWSPPASGAGRPNTDVAVLERGGAAPKRLTDSPGLDAYPAWSPDGSRIAFASDRSGGRRQIFVMRKDGSGVAQLTHDGGLEFAAPSWSPDGSRIACTASGPGGQRLHVLTVAGLR